MSYLSTYGKLFCVELQTYNLKLRTKIYKPYIKRRVLYSVVKVQELLDLRAHKCFETPSDPMFPEANIMPWEKPELRD